MIQDNVVKLIQPAEFSDPLTEVLREGARALLAQAVEAEIAAFLSGHADRQTEDGRQRWCAMAIDPARDHDRPWPDRRACAAGSRPLRGRREPHPVHIRDPRPMRVAP